VCPLLGDYSLGLLAIVGRRRRRWCSTIARVRCG
jgi:hypothetical protein